MKYKSYNEELAKNTIIIAIGRFSTKFLAFFLLPLYTAILTTKEYGLVDLVSTYVALLVPVVNMQLEMAIFRFVVVEREDKKKIKSIVSTILIITIFLLIIYTIIYIIVQNFFENDYKEYIYITVITTIFLNSMAQIARGIGDNIAYSIGNFVSSMTIIFFNILLLVVYKLGVRGMLTAYFIGPLIGGIFLFFKCKVWRYISLSAFEKKDIKKYLRYSLPLVPNELSWWILHVSDRTIVSFFLGIASNGLLAIATKFSAMFTTIFNTFGLSWNETVVLHYNDSSGKEYIEKTFNKCFSLFSSACFGIIVLMPFMFDIIVNPKYFQAYYQIPIYMLSSLSNMIIGLLGPIYIVNQKTKEIAKTTIIAAIINILFNITLIKFIGLYAASISSVFGYSIVMFYRYKDVQKYLKIKLTKKNMSSTIIMALISFTTYYSQIIILQLVGIILIVVIAINLNKETLKSIIKKLKLKG